ncbi:MAG TPA: NlpC/P60 family protein [Candidatus Limnocylindrales bacterium]
MKSKRGLLGALALAVLALSGCAVAAADPPSAGGTEWDAGNIISDAVFYNSAAFGSVFEVQTALDRIGASCTASTCLRSAQYTPGALDTTHCRPWPGPGGAQSFASILYYLGQACGVNPQVAIIMIQKESQGLLRSTPPAALTGFGCPDTGPGGSANCNAAMAGVWAQTAGMFQSFARLRADASRVNYIEGQTHNILWNVAETGCGSAPVLVANRATATLYTYTPYQPNAASLAAYPGTGDRCSAYGNRNFFRLFQKEFGPTGGGRAIPGTGGTNVANGVNIQIPNNQFVAEAARGKTIQAPSEAMAHGIAAGFDQLGLPYVWGGSDANGGPADEGCSRGGGALNSCQGTVGFDCSGLTGFVLAKAGFHAGTNSSAQRGSGQSVPFSDGRAGDIAGRPGHVALWLGTVDGQAYVLEASTVGQPIKVRPSSPGEWDSSLHRHWSSSPVA